MLLCPATFEAKVNSAGLSTLWPKIKANGWDTISTFATSCNFRPDKVDEEEFARIVGDKLFDDWDGQSAPVPPLWPRVRCLMWDAIQCFLSESRTRHQESDGERTCTNLTTQDRKQRRENLHARHDDEHI